MPVKSLAKKLLGTAIMKVSAEDFSLCMIQGKNPHLASYWIVPILKLQIILTQFIDSSTYASATQQVTYSSKHATITNSILRNSNVLV